MQIQLTPQRRDDELVLACEGDTLVVNGVQYDFSQLPDGASLPAAAMGNDLFNGPVSRVGGVLFVCLVRPFKPLPPEVCPQMSVLEPADGPINLPVYEAAQ